MVTKNFSSESSYWKERKDSVYLFCARAICGKYGANVHSVIDVGSNRTPTLEWHRDQSPRLVSLDLRNPYVAPGVESITIDFLKYSALEKFDMVTCFQVLEHVPDAKAFAQKLLEIGKTLVVSVPYNWERGKCKYHIHDPVDREKMFLWFERKPVYSYIARELNKVERLISVYQ
jgi:hypothetical protein